MINLAVTRSTTVRRAARSTTGCFWPLSATQGIECSTLLQSGAPEYFLDAYNEHANWLPNGTDWALGIESADNRSRDQLHIHISRLIPDARKDIDKQVEGDRHRRKQVEGQRDHGAGQEVPCVERRHPESQPVQASERRHRYTVQGADGTKPCSSPDAPNTCNGFIVLNSDKVGPNTNPGANNIEFLLDKGLVDSQPLSEPRGADPKRKTHNAHTSLCAERMSDPSHCTVRGNPQRIPPSGEPDRRIRPSVTLFALSVQHRQFRQTVAGQDDRRRQNR